MLVSLAASMLMVSAAQVDQGAAQAYAALLAKHVSGGRVAYRAIEKEREGLDRYLDAVGRSALPAQRADRIAFWVDAYNALVIKSVIAHGHPKKVIDVKGFFDEKVHRVAGQVVSLNQLEKELLNPYAKDPRTHFVLVCAAVGCPILEAKPYVGSDLEPRLAAATRRYLTSPTGAEVKPGRLRLSMIFSWYEKDFGGRDGVLAFVRRWLPKDQAEILGSKPELEFLEYDWRSNGR